MLDSGNDNVMLQLGAPKARWNKVKKLHMRTEKPSVRKVEQSEAHVLTTEEIDYIHYVEGMTPEEAGKDVNINIYRPGEDDNSKDDEKSSIYTATESSLDDY